MSSYKQKFACTLRQVFIRLNRLEIQLVMFGIFHPALTFSLISSLPLLPLPGVNKYTVSTFTVYRGRGYGVMGLRQINTCREVPLQLNFLDDDILHRLHESFLSKVC